MSIEKIRRLARRDCEPRRRPHRHHRHGEAPSRNRGPLSGTLPVMILTATSRIEGMRILQHHDMVTGGGDRRRERLRGAASSTTPVSTSAAPSRAPAQAGGADDIPSSGGWGRLLVPHSSDRESDSAIHGDTARLPPAQNGVPGLSARERCRSISPGGLGVRSVIPAVCRPCGMGTRKTVERSLAPGGAHDGIPPTGAARLMVAPAPRRSPRGRRPRLRAELLADAASLRCR